MPSLLGVGHSCPTLAIYQEFLRAFVAAPTPSGTLWSARALLAPFRGHGGDPKFPTTSISDSLKVYTQYYTHVITFATMGLILFLDESGDHSLSKVDPQHPVFVLCGVLMDDSYHQTTATLAKNKHRML